MFKPIHQCRSIWNRQSIATIGCAIALVFAGARSAQALTITGTVGGQKYLLTGSQVNVSTNAILKMSFETTSGGDNLELCAGTVADFLAGLCPTRLSDSGGPGFRFLTIVDAASLNGKHIYIIRAEGINPASFSFTIE